jgi:lysophospholipase L1-like esterase
MPHGPPDGRLCYFDGLMSTRLPRPHLPIFFVCALQVVACGGGGPTGPGPAAPTHSVVVTAFYDENGNGTLDLGENTRLGEIELEVAGRTGKAEKQTGRATVASVPEGTHRVGVRAASLPPFFQTHANFEVSVQSPQPAGADVFFPLILPLGPRSRPNIYLGFGDSITSGDGSVHHDGYADTVQGLLRGHFGQAGIILDGVNATRTDRGAARLPFVLNDHRPAYVLILYGTNDWNRQECKDDRFPCDMVENIRDMVRTTKAAGALPVVGTIPPTNPTQTIPERNLWVSAINKLIKAMALQEGAAVADVEAAFLRQPSLSALFDDHVHPNDRGYEVLGEAFFLGIVTPIAR